MQGIMQSYTAVCLAAAVLMFAPGCATHSAGAGTAINQLKAGNTAAALLWSEKLKTSSRSGDLGLVESGRIKMLSGDFAGSRADFEAAIDKMIE